MHDSASVDDAVALLQSLGLKEYEAKCFVGLARVDSATAKEVSDLSDVPRTRVYDAVDALADRGLVETRQSNPQRFRAVPVEEAAETLRNDYDARIGDLRDALGDLPAAPETDADATPSVWALSGTAAVENRAARLVGAATDAVVLVVGGDPALADGLLDELAAAADRGASLVVGTADTALGEAVADRVPAAAVFRSDLDWLRADDRAEVGRLLLVDGETALVSSVAGDDEHAVVARGAANGVVLVVRRLLDAAAEGESTPSRPD